MMTTSQDWTAEEEEDFLRFCESLNQHPADKEMSRLLDNDDFYEIVIIDEWCDLELCSC